MNMPNPKLDTEALYASLATQVKAALANAEQAAIVGINSGGARLAERLAAELQLTHRLGFNDNSFYRDDYAEKGLHADVKPTLIPSPAPLRLPRASISIFSAPTTATFPLR